MFELSNEQRKYLGLDEIRPDWDRYILKADSYTPETIVYFEDNIITRHILSTDKEYSEHVYFEKTENRATIFPKTDKGKPVKLTVSKLRSKTPIGVYFHIDKKGYLKIGNHTTQQTFYSSYWENHLTKPEIVDNFDTFINTFIDKLPQSHNKDIAAFKAAKRQNVKYKTGDFFVFKVSLREYGFGRILFDIGKVRKKKLLPSNHGFYSIMGPALLVAIYPVITTNKEIDIQTLASIPLLLSDYVWDNHIYYGDHEIIGNIAITENEIDFPMSYGRKSVAGEQKVFFQWGLIHIEKNMTEFNKYLDDNSRYNNYGIGFNVWCSTSDIKDAIKNGGEIDYSKYSNNYNIKSDLRIPENKIIRDEIMAAFGLDSAKSYSENRRIAAAPDLQVILDKLL